MYAQAIEQINKPNEPARRIRAGIVAFWRYVEQHRPFFGMFFRAMPMRHLAIRQKLGGAVQEGYERYKAIEGQVLRDAQKQGHVRDDLSINVLQEFMEAVATSFVEQWVLSEAPTSVEQQVKRVWGLMAGGIGAEGDCHHEGTKARK